MVMPQRVWVISILLLSSVFLFSGVSAQTAERDIPESLLPLARELGCETQRDCEAAFNANFTQGIELAEKYDVYNDAQRRIAQSFKSEVLAKLQNVSEDRFEEEIIKIAETVLSKPTIARRLSITGDEVRAAKTIVAEVKEAGVSLSVCRQSEESLTREQLVACLKASKQLAAKADVVEVYIPQQRIEQIDMSSKMADLEDALVRGEYSDVGRTSDEAGLNCLRSGSESLKSCDIIAEKYFGSSGIEELRQARSRVAQTGDYYKKGLESLSLITPDGRTIVGRDAIMRICDQAFRTRSVELARVCGDFAVRNGFASSAEVEEGLKIFESTVQANVNFDQCRANPKSCEQYVPQEYKGGYDVGNQIFEIMTAEGVDPERCRLAEFDPEIGKTCFENTKRALPKLRELAAKSSVAAKMVQDIERSIGQGERYLERKSNFEQEFRSMGGPGGCRTQDECFKFCSNSANGAECLAFGAKHQVFNKTEVMQRYERYNQLFVPPPQVFFGSDDAFVSPPPTSGTYYGGAPFPPTQYQVPLPAPAGQAPYPVGPTGGYAPAQPYPVSSIGPSPECFAAIQAGDFVRAKEICNAPRPMPYPQYPTPQPPSGQPYPYPYPPQPQPYPYPQPQPYPYPSQCPQVSPLPCPEGQKRESNRNEFGCYVYGACVPIGEQVPPGSVCPLMPTVVSCGQGEERYVTFRSPECGEYYGCRKIETSILACPTGQFRNPATNACETSLCTDPATCGANGCPRGDRGWDTWCSKYVPISGGQTCPSGQYWYVPPGGGAGYCQTSGTGGGTTSCSQSLVTLLGSGCHYMYNDTSGRATYCDGSMTKSAKEGDATTTQGCSSGASTVPPTSQREQIWNSLGLKSWIRADADLARIEQLKQACISVQPPSNIWMPNAGDYASNDFGMPDPNKCQQAVSCPVGQYWSGSACVSSTTTTCPAGQYWNGTACVNSTSGGGCRSYASQSSCSAITGCVWYQNHYDGTHCDDQAHGQSSSTTCPAGQYWYVPSSGGQGYCTSSSANSNYPSVPTGPTASAQSSSRIDLSWTASTDNIGVTKYNIHRNGVYLTSVGGAITSYSDTGLYSSTSYSYYVIAYDADGNYSPQSTSVSATTFSSGTGGGGGTTSCSQSLVTLLGDGCHYMYNDASGRTIYCDGAMTKSAKEGDAATTQGCSSGGSTGTTCPSGQYWYVPPSGGAGYCTSSSGATSGSCTAELTNLLGSGCHNMSNAWFNGDMTQYVLPNTTQVKSCASEYISGCATSGGSQTCPSGQYWNGTSCVNSTTTTCPSGQYWYVPPGGGAGYCQTTTTTDCPSGQYWYVPPGGGAGYCQTTTTTTCPSGQYWNGTACVSSTTTTCPSGQYWDGSACVSSTTTTCPSGQYWNGSACVNSTTTSDPAAACTQAGGTWNSATNYCQMPSSSGFIDYTIAQIGSVLNQLTMGLLGLFRW